MLARQVWLKTYRINFGLFCFYIHLHFFFFLLYRTFTILDPAHITDLIKYYGRKGYTRSNSCKKTHCSTSMHHVISTQAGFSWIENLKRRINPWNRLEFSFNSTRSIRSRHDRSVAFMIAFYMHMRSPVARVGFCARLTLFYLCIHFHRPFAWQEGKRGRGVITRKGNTNKHS